MESCLFRINQMCGVYYGLQLLTTCEHDGFLVCPAYTSVRCNMHTNSRGQCRVSRQVNKTSCMKAVTHVYMRRHCCCTLINKNWSEISTILDVDTKPAQ